ncbi:MAG: acetoacetate decarboxylase family protein [Candidatus Alcyoniella australis]|nr:acetoacetate decarboxylase family protein [Candidatus Alcyoniella australis]
MDPTFNIDPGLLDNANEFSDPFFERFTLRSAPQPLKLNDAVSKDYKFPTFYGDVTCAMAVFLCSYQRAKELLPHPKMEPVRMPRGRALVAFSNYVYRKVLGVAPYNEIAMTIPIQIAPRINVPLLPMVLDVFPRFGYYVFSMPVTSLENQIRGLKIWGLPKVVQRIDIDDENGDCVTRAFEESGDQYFELRVPKAGKPTGFDVCSNLYSRLGNELKQSRTCFKAQFNVTKRMDLLFKTNVEPDREYLKLGNGPSAEVLKRLELERQPFQLRYAERMSSCFDLSNADYKPPFGFEDK